MAEKAISLDRLKQFFTKLKDVFALKDHTHAVATTTSPGIMSAEDKTKLDSLNEMTWVITIAQSLPEDPH